MTKEETKAYAQKLLKEQGVSDEDITLYLKAFENEKFAQGFIPRPEVDRSLSAEKSKYSEYQKRNEYLENQWYPEAKKSAERAEALVNNYNKYVELYGPIDQNSQASMQHASGATGMTQQQIQELLKAKDQEWSDRLAATQQATLELAKVQSAYRKKFKEELDIDEFEKHVMEQRNKGNRDSMSAIYRDWSGELESKSTPHRYSDDALKAHNKRIADEAVKDFASRNKLPIDSRPKEPHLLFDRAKPKSEEGKPNGKSGREAFLEVMNDPEPETVRQRYPV